MFVSKLFNTLTQLLIVLIPIRLWFGYFQHRYVKNPHEENYPPILNYYKKLFHQHRNIEVIIIIIIIIIIDDNLLLKKGLSLHMMFYGTIELWPECTHIIIYILSN